jgi:hypothetical protein
MKKIIEFLRQTSTSIEFAKTWIRSNHTTYNGNFYNKFNITIEFINPDIAYEVTRIVVNNKFEGTTHTLDTQEENYIIDLLKNLKEFS